MVLDACKIGTPIDRAHHELSEEKFGNSPPLVMPEGATAAPVTTSKSPVSAVSPTLEESRGYGRKLGPHEPCVGFVIEHLVERACM
jgi:hypothetical protein